LVCIDCLTGCYAAAREGHPWQAGHADLNTKTTGGCEETQSW